MKIDERSATERALWARAQRYVDVYYEKKRIKRNAVIAIVAFAAVILCYWLIPGQRTFLFGMMVGMVVIAAICYDSFWLREKVVSSSELEEHSGPTLEEITAIGRAMFGETKSETLSHVRTAEDLEPESIRRFEMRVPETDPLREVPRDQ